MWPRRREMVSEHGTVAMSALPNRQPVPKSAKRHHTVRTVFGTLIALMYFSYVGSYVALAQVPPPDGLLLGGLSTAMIALYKAKKGRGEEDRRSDESVL